MDKSIINLNKNQIFNRALFIIMPEDDNINGNLYNNGFKSLDNNYNGIDILEKRFLSSSLLKKIEGETPESEKEFIIDLENSINSDSDKPNFRNKINNNKDLSEEEKNDNNNYFLKSSFIKKINFNNICENNINPCWNNNINYFKNAFFFNNKEENQNINYNQEEEKNLENLKEKDYIFERFGKRGWECSKCNNFNFESRIKCNRCYEIKSPKTLKRIKKEMKEKNLEDKKKKCLVERKGDWQCPKCNNLNFYFRKECNRCHLSKEKYFNYKNQGNNFFKVNYINKPQNQMNIIYNYDFPYNTFHNINHKDIFYNWNYQNNSNNNFPINNFYV